jgi:hypothetical protein
MNALGPLGKASSDTTPGSNTIVFDLQEYTFEQYGAHFILTIAVKNSTGEVFKKIYAADGKTQGGKMFWTGPFGMKMPFSNRPNWQWIKSSRPLSST